MANIGRPRRILDIPEPVRVPDRLPDEDWPMPSAPPTPAQPVEAPDRAAPGSAAG
ncbi:MAG: hypothetical protein ACKVWR_08775 [Acidimicrobiales bacterium]